MAEKKTVKKKKTNEFSKLTINEARKEMQKIAIQIQEGVEKDTSKLRKIKKYIARKLTEQNKSNG